MFCKYCGAQVEDGVPFCSQCGGNLTAAPSAQPKPQPQMAQPKPQNAIGSGDIVEILKKNLHYIIAGLAALAFIWGILNVFSVFHVKLKASGWGERGSEYMPISDLEGMDGIGAAYVGNIFFGLACLAVAAIGVLYFLKAYKNMPYYDQYIGKWLKFRPAFAMGALGAAGALLQMLLYLFCGMGGFGIRISVGVNWTTWLMLVLFAALAVVDKFLLEEKKEAPAQFQDSVQ